MINAVIELGDQRVHEVMVPRIAHGRPGRRRDASSEAIDTVIDEGHSADPGLRGHRSTRSSGSSTPRTCCRSSRAGRRAAGAPLDPADAGLRPRVDVRRRPAPRAPAEQGPHRDRARRVRRDRRPRHDRGPARGDRRRDPGRVRRGGAADRPALRRRGADRRAGGDRRPRRAVRHRSSTLEDEDEYDTIGGLVFHRIGGVPKPGRPGRGRRADADRRDDRRPAGRQGPRRARARRDDPDDDEADR